MSAQRILLVRCDGLGDTLLSTPLLAALSDARPGAEITVLASPLGAEGLAANPRVHGLEVADLRTAGLLDRLRLALKLRRRGFDVAICLSEKRWPRLITWLTGSRLRIGFDPGSTQPLVSLLCRFALTHRVRSGGVHETERYTGLLGPLGLEAAPGRLEIHFSQEDRDWAARWMSSHLPERAVPVIVNVNAKWTRDGWSADELAVMIAGLLEAAPEVFLIATCDKSDARLVEGLSERIRDGRVHIVAGESFGRWASLIALSRAVVTMDTGAVHVAAALGIPVVDIFPSEGLEHCSRRWSPWGVEHRIIRRDPLDRNGAQAQIGRFTTDVTYALDALLWTDRRGKEHQSLQGQT